MNRYSFFLILVMLTSCMGGTPYTQQLILNQASFDFDCDQTDIKVSPLGKGRYVVSGCLQREVYSCKDSWFTFKENIVCTQDISP